MSDPMLSKKDEASTEPQQENPQPQSSQKQVVSIGEINQGEEPTIEKAKLADDQEQAESNSFNSKAAENLSAASDNAEHVNEASDQLLLPTKIDEQNPQNLGQGKIDVDKIDESSVQEIQPVPDQMKADYDTIHQATALPGFVGDSQQIVADDEKSEEAEIEHNKPAEILNHSENLKQPEVEGDVSTTNTAVEQARENSASQVAEDEFNESNDEFMTSDEDFQSVAAFYSIPLELLKSNRSLFTSLLVKFSDFEKLKSSNQYLEINYEQLQYSHKKKIDLVKKELISARNELQALASSQRKLIDEKDELESALKNSNSLTSRNSQCVGELKFKLAELEKYKTNISELLEGKQSQLNELNEEMKTLADEKKKLRENMLDLESSKEGTISELMTSKFEVAKLQRESNC